MTESDSAITPSFWAGKRVLVTGHTGFKGSWLSLWLTRLGADVTGYSTPPPTEPSLYRQAGIGEQLASIEGDIRSLDAVRTAMAGSRPEIVLHLAAQPLVRRSFAAPLETYETNVIGTANVLEAVREQSDVRAVVVVTSDKCYAPRPDGRPHAEQDPKGGNDPYSSSKACAELVVDAYRSSFSSSGLAAVATARAGNVIGGGDWAVDRLVPDLIRGALNATPVLIRNPAAVRPWQHVLCPLSGYLLLAQRLWEQPTLAGGWNFGPEEGDARPVSWVADRLAELWGPELRWERDPADHPIETHSLRLDCRKAAQRLDWRPAWDLDQALAAVIEFHRRHDSGEDARAVLLAQLAEFSAAASLAA